MADAKATTTEGTLPDEKQEQYIRTFAGDVATLQKGGKPDLVLLKEDQPEPKERLIAASPIGSAPLPAPAPGLPAPFSKFHMPPPQTNVPKTYAGDFTEKVHETNASTATVLAAEQDSRPAPSPATPPVPASSWGSRLYTVAGVVLVIAGVAGASVAYLRYQDTLAPVVLAPGASAPIFVDEREEIIGSGAALLSAVEKSLSRPLASDTVRLLSVASSTAGSVFAALPLSAPAALVRNVNTAGSMAGIVSTGSRQSIFFLLSVSSYSNTFAAMLSWEKKMPRDLIRLFPPYPVAVSNTVATSTATSTAGSLTSTSSMGFVDITIANHDVRAYRDTAGRDIILYGYWNQSTLVIARDAAAFAEILGRLASSRARN